MIGFNISILGPQMLCPFDAGHLHMSSIRLPSASRWHVWKFDCLRCSSCDGVFLSADDSKELSNIILELSEKLALAHDVGDDDIWPLGQSERRTGDEMLNTDGVPPDKGGPVY